MKKILLFTAFIAITQFIQAQTVSPDSAKFYEGKMITMSGKVMSTFKSQGDKKKIILNFGKPFPDQTFSVIIFEENFPKFSYEPDKFLKDKMVNIKGKVTVFKDKPQIIVTSPKQIEIIDSK